MCSVCLVLVMQIGFLVAKMLQIELLPAGPGDCLWLEYGEPGKTHIILIDGGVNDTFEPLEKRICQAITEHVTNELYIDLLVVTHIDNDHIEGVLRLLNETKYPITYGDVWFNGNHQLKNLPAPSAEERRPDLLGDLGDIPRPDLLGLREGDKLSSILATPKIRWNNAFNGAAVMIPVQGKLPSLDLCGGLKLTVLGPPVLRLRKLAEDWKQVKDEEFEERNDLLGSKDTWPPVWLSLPTPDKSVKNGSSIVLLAEYGDKRLLLTGDAHAADIEAGVSRLLTERNLPSRPFPITALKLPHHGSAKNISQNLLEKLNCSQYLVSTNGSGNPKHPDHQALLRVLKFTSKQPRLAFNYDVETTHDWRDSRQDVLSLGLGFYETDYATKNDQGLVVKLE